MILLCLVILVWYLQQENQLFNGTPQFKYCANMVTNKKTRQADKTKTLSYDMEIVIRMPVTEKFVKRLFCDVLRSSTVMWNSTFLGNFLLILDDGDRVTKGPHLLTSLSKLQKVHEFRAVYEKDPNNKDGVAKAGKHIGNRTATCYNSTPASSWTCTLWNRS